MKRNVLLVELPPHKRNLGMGNENLLHVKDWLDVAFIFKHLIMFMSWVILFIIAPLLVKC